MRAVKKTQLNSGSALCVVTLGGAVGLCLVPHSAAGAWSPLPGTHRAASWHAAGLGDWEYWAVPGDPAASCLLPQCCGLKFSPEGSEF